MDMACEQYAPTVGSRRLAADSGTFFCFIKKEGGAVGISST